MKVALPINKSIAPFAAQQNKMNYTNCYSILLTLMLLLTSCGVARTQLEPKVTYFAQKKDLRCLPSSFPPLINEEKNTDWGKELLMGEAFSHELDYYRAITCYQRALFLLPYDSIHRRYQIEYDIVLSYYLAHRYHDAILYFEESSLIEAGTLFPALDNLLTILYESYLETDIVDKSDHILAMIETYSPDTAIDLSLFTALENGDFSLVYPFIPGHRSQMPIQQFLQNYCSCAKSPFKARLFNALLPGSGYLYVGQKKSALTSFLINASFIAAAYQFFQRGYWAAGAITTSLEFGWYIGGINGAGIEAQEYNNRLYERTVCPLLVQEKFFPILSFQRAF